jgi:hypothetical protein
MTALMAVNWSMLAIAGDSQLLYAEMMESCPPARGGPLYVNKHHMATFTVLYSVY